MSRCAGCGTPLPPNKAPGRPRKWCTDRCRKIALYSRACVDCGAVINTDGSVARASTRCNPCNANHSNEMTRRWILDSFAEWYERFGEVPVVADWSPAHARQKPSDHWRIPRHEATGRPWPSSTVVARHFGSWSEGVRAAGFEPLKPNEWWLGRRGVTLRNQDQEAA